MSKPLPKLSPAQAEAWGRVLVWERDNWRDDIPGYYSQFGPYSVHQYSLVNDAE